MNTLIVIGVLGLLAAIAVLYYEWRVELSKRIAAEIDNANWRTRWYSD